MSNYKIPFCAIDGDTSNISTALINQMFPLNPDAPRLVVFIPDAVRKHPFIDYDSFANNAYHFKMIVLLLFAQVYRRRNMKARQKVGPLLESCALFVEVVEGGWYLILCENLDDPPEEKEDDEEAEPPGESTAEAKEAEEEEEGGWRSKKFKSSTIKELKSIADWLRDYLYMDSKGTLLSSQKDSRKTAIENQAWQPLFDAMAEDSEAVALYKQYSYLSLLNSSEIDRNDLASIFHIRTAVACRLMYQYNLTKEEARTMVTSERPSRVFIDTDDANRLAAGGSTIICHPQNAYRLKHRQCDPLRFKLNLPPTFKIPADFLQVGESSGGRLMLSWQSFFEKRVDYLKQANGNLEEVFKRRLDLLRLSPIYLNNRVQEGEVPEMCYQQHDTLKAALYPTRFRMDARHLDCHPFFSLTQRLLDVMRNYIKLYGCLSEALFLHTIMSTNFIIDDQQLNPAVICDGPPGVSKSYLMQQIRRLHLTPVVCTYETAKSMMIGDRNDRGGYKINDDAGPATLGIASNQKMDPVTLLLQIMSGSTISEQGTDAEFIKKLLTLDGNNLRTKRGHVDSVQGSVGLTVTDTVIYFVCLMFTNVYYRSIPTAIKSRCHNMPFYGHTRTESHKADILDSQTTVETTSHIAGSGILDAYRLEWVKMAVLRMYTCFSLESKTSGSGGLPPVDLRVFDIMVNMTTNELENHVNYDARAPRPMTICRKMVTADVIHAAFTVVFGMGIGGPPPGERFKMEHLQLLTPFMFCTPAIAMFRIQHQLSFSNRLHRKIVAALLKLNRDVDYYVTYLMNTPNTTATSSDDLTLVGSDSADNQQRLAASSSLAAVRRTNPSVELRSRYPTFMATMETTRERVCCILPTYLPGRQRVRVVDSGGQTIDAVLYNERYDATIGEVGVHPTLLSRRERELELSKEQCIRDARDTQANFSPLVDQDRYVRIPNVFPRNREANEEPTRSRFNTLNSNNNNQQQQPQQPPQRSQHAIIKNHEPLAKWLNELVKLLSVSLDIRPTVEQLFGECAEMTSAKRMDYVKRTIRVENPDGAAKIKKERIRSRVPELIFSMEEGAIVLYLHRGAIDAHRKNVAVVAMQSVQPPDLPGDCHPLVYTDFDESDTLQKIKLQPCHEGKNHIRNPDYNCHMDNELMRRIPWTNREKFKQLASKERIYYTGRFATRQHVAYRRLYIPESSPMSSSYSDEAVVIRLARLYHEATTAVDTDTEEKLKFPSVNTWKKVCAMFDGYNAHGALHYCASPLLITKWFHLQGFSDVLTVNGCITDDKDYRRRLVEVWRKLYPDLATEGLVSVKELERVCKEQWVYRPYKIDYPVDTEDELEQLRIDAMLNDSDFQQDVRSLEEIREKRVARYDSASISPVSTSSSSSSSSSSPVNNNRMTVDDEDPFEEQDSNKRQRDEVIHEPVPQKRPRESSPLDFSSLAESFGTMPNSRYVPPSMTISSRPRQSPPPRVIIVEATTASSTDSNQ